MFSSFVPRNGWQAEPSPPSETNKSSSSLHSSSDIGFQEPQLDKILEREEAVKEEQWQVELQGCTKTGGKYRKCACHCSDEEHIPRYMPSGLHGLGDHLESHILFHEKDGSLLPRNYNHNSSSSYRSTRLPPLPPSPRMPSPGSCWPVLEHGSEAPISSALRTTPLHTRNATNIVLPPTPSESCRSASGNEMLHNATVNIAGNPMTSHNVEAVAQMAIGHERLIVKEAEVMEKESEHNQTKFELLLSPRFESSQPNSAVDIESPQDSLMSDTESDSDGDWLTGPYIPDFLREQWLNGSALEMPTMEAGAMAIVKQALVDEVMAAFPIFDPSWAADFTSNTGYGDNPSSFTTTSKSNKDSVSNSSSSNNGRKRSWYNEDDPPAGGNDGPPDPLRLNPGSPQGPQPGLKLACPFRKRDPETYNLHDYRVCATKPWSSISRLKTHLKLVHKAPIYCPKCKHIFETSEDLESHLDVPDEEHLRACKHRDVPKPAGMTPAMEEKLQGRWRASAPQALWGKIYEILFPNEDVPSPDFEQVLDISIPTGLVSPTPNFERPSQRDFLRFVRARVENAVDIDIKSLPERAKSMLADIVEDCYIQFGLLYQTTQEARQRTSSLTRACQQPPDNETLQMETQQQTYWDTMEYSSSQGGVQSKGKGTQINRVAPPPLSFAVAPPLQTPGADSNRSNCSCIGQCTCSAPTSSASVVPDMDFGDSDLYMREYETLWNGGPTDMNLFNSFVNDEDRSFFHPEL